MGLNELQTKYFKQDYRVEKLMSQITLNNHTRIEHIWTFYKFRFIAFFQQILFDKII